MSSSLAEEWAACDDGWAGAEPDADDSEPPEHLHWPEAHEVRILHPLWSVPSARRYRPGFTQMEELSGTPPAPAASLVTSAAASLVSMWRGWTK